MIYQTASMDEALLTYPLNHPRIMYNDLVRAATVSSFSEATGYPADAVQRPDTYERWKPVDVAAARNLNFDYGAAVDINCICIAAHTLGTSGATVRVRYSDDDITYYSYFNSTLITDDSTIMILGNTESHRYWRVQIVSATVPPEIGVVYMGVVLEVERTIFGGHTPVSMSRVTAIRPTKSIGGQFLGRSIIRNGSQNQVAINNLTPSWYKTNFDPFALSAREYPFFFAFKPGTYTSDVVYGSVSQDIVPSVSGQGKGLYNVSFTIDGFVDEN